MSPGHVPADMSPGTYISQGTCPRGHVSGKIHGSLDPWIPGSLDPWIRGFMDAWTHGSMDPEGIGQQRNTKEH